MGAAADIESGLVKIWALDLLTPPENELIYRAIRYDDPEIVKLARSIRQDGLLQPLTVSADFYILDGNRRRAACALAGLNTIPCRVRADLRHGDPDFVRVLREFNRQRDKTVAERIREEMVTIEPAKAYEALTAQRIFDSMTAIRESDAVTVRQARGRATISAARQPMLEAVQRVIHDLADYLPLSDRQIHYALLNAAPLIHASKPGSTYSNNRASYQVLCDLLTRARLEGVIGFEDIADATRPHQPWATVTGVAEYVANKVRGFGRGYWRDLLQSQPNHVEIVAEKLTVQTVVERVAQRYTIPVTIMRGYPSLDLRYRLAERYRASGRDRLVLLVLSDHDPDGQEIMHSLGASLADEFDLAFNLHMVRVAITGEQIADLGLPPSMEAKESSHNFAKFAAKHGRYAYELESIPPPALESILAGTIERNLDLSRFRQEVEQEKADAAEIAARQKILARAMLDAPDAGGDAP
jgi:hypothetical protein